MGKHNNLYYLLMEDQQQNLIDLQAKEKIKKNIENFYKEIKPPWKVNPPISIGDSKSIQQTLPVLLMAITALDLIVQTTKI